MYHNIEEVKVNGKVIGQVYQDSFGNWIGNVESFDYLPNSFKADPKASCIEWVKTFNPSEVN